MRVKWYSSCSRKEQEQNPGSLACPLWPGSFNGVRVGADPWSRLRAGLGGLPTPLVVLCAGVMPNPALLLSPQKQQYISVFFCVSLFIIAQTAQCLQIFLVCYRLFVFCCSRRCLFRCQVQALQYRNSGPSLSQFERFMWSL